MPAILVVSIVLFYLPSNIFFAALLFSPEICRLAINVDTTGCHDLQGEYIEF